MRKITFIITCVAVLYGCSVVKSRETAVLNPGDKNIGNLSDILGNNLTNSDFYIEKAEIEIAGTDGKQKLLGSVKYKSKGKYLISIRSRTGIEAARIYFDSDTILVNDRINQKLITGSASQLSNKYGIAAGTFPVIFGDLIVSAVDVGKSIKCIDGKTEIFSSNVGEELRYVVDCSDGKVSLTELKAFRSSDSFIAEFKNYRAMDKIIYPGLIEIVDRVNKTEIRIEIIRISHELLPDLEFIPGKNYELILLK